jgi:hypothetical protein
MTLSPTVWRRMAVSLMLISAAATILCLARPASAGTVDSPGAFASLSTAGVGDLVDITGTDWAPEGGIATVQICGQDAQNLSSDCDESNTYSAAIRAGGSFAAALYVRIPLSPCPCVIFVTSTSGQSSKIPIQIVGAPYRPISVPVPTVVPVKLASSLDVPLSVSSWFGGPKDLTLNLRVTNLTGTMLPQSVITVTVGRKASSAATVAGQTLAMLPAGATRTVRIPFTIPAVTYGHYSVFAQVATEQGSVTSSLPTTSWPWAWLVVIIELILLVAVSTVRRGRERRLARAEPPPPTAETPAVTPEPVLSETV